MGVSEIGLAPMEGRWRVWASNRDDGQGRPVLLADTGMLQARWEIRTRGGRTLDTAETFEEACAKIALYPGLAEEGAS